MSQARRGSRWSRRERSRKLFTWLSAWPWSGWSPKTSRCFEKNTGEKNKSLLLPTRLNARAWLCVQVWFRRGVNSYNPCGSGWISIGGEMLMVDVGLNDQVLLMLFLFPTGRIQIFIALALFQNVVFFVLLLCGTESVVLILTGLCYFFNCCCTVEFCVQTKCINV